MATTNPFDLLIDDDAGDPSVLIAVYEQKAAAAAAAAAAAEKLAIAVATTKSAKLPSKPLPPAQAVREARNERGRGARGYGRGRGANGAISNRENLAPNENGFTLDPAVQKPYEGRIGFDNGRGGRRGGFSNGDADGDRRRNYERRSGTGRGSEIKRDGAGRGNWGTTNDDIVREVEEPIAENEVNVAAEKPAGEEENVDAEKETTVKKAEEDPEEKQYTLEEYEKILEEKRKALLSLSEQKKGEERKIDVKEFQSMQLVSKKKNDDEVFIKLDSEKDKKREAAEREEKSKKSVSINEFLKPAEGETHYRSGGRGRGRGRGDRGGRHGGGGGYARNNGSAPKIEDNSQFPALGGN
ncbi:RGG repeats nuclear RNA binding protein A-like [Silene latifolia]|uniref:RGG repeats nuclear RNA binding protein A-like n=1 Tax=Silene latifolia TaxID=37657 RepID=UPI003D78944C